MVVPDLLHGLQEHLSLLALLYRVIGHVGGKCGDNELVRELVKVVGYKLRCALVEALPVLVEYHVVCISMVLLKRKVRGVVVLNLDDVLAKLAPRLVHRDVRAML